MPEPSPARWLDREAAASLPYPTPMEATPTQEYPS